MLLCMPTATDPFHGRQESEPCLAQANKRCWSLSENKYVIRPFESKSYLRCHFIWLRAPIVSVFIPDLLFIIKDSSGDGQFYTFGGIHLIQLVRFNELIGCIACVWVWVFLFRNQGVTHVQWLRLEAIHLFSFYFAICFIYMVNILY